jgi:hypothetical protein
MAAAMISPEEEGSSGSRGARRVGKAASRRAGGLPAGGAALGSGGGPALREAMGDSGFAAGGMAAGGAGLADGAGLAAGVGPAGRAGAAEPFAAWGSALKTSWHFPHLTALPANWSGMAQRV